ncbi:MAG: hypothetical protein H6R15_1341 [Proteobacteria bacterium]|nr:hypothetical protein [Pseudomonadota bacterium]
MSQYAEAAAELPPQIAVPPYRHEKALFGILATVSVLFWILLTVGTIGIVWIYMLFIYLFVLFAHSALISFLKGNAVRIDAGQFPDLHQRISACCQRLGVATLPESYLMTGDGMLNAFATRFLRRYYVVLLSDVVDALDDDPEAINFYIGHELGHIHRQHLANAWWMGPALLMPLLGAAYRRAQEYTCDQYGRACCGNPLAATRALGVLAAGTRRWKTLSADAYVKQCEQTGGFWMSVNELASDYPWLCKRMAHLHHPGQRLPARHPLAWLLSAFIPRLGLGPAGPLFSLLMLFFIVGLLAAIAIPAYQDYKTKAEVAPLFLYGDALSKAMGDYYKNQQELPKDLSALPIKAPEALLAPAELNGENGEISLPLKNNAVITYSPSLDENGDLLWSCSTTLVARTIPKGFPCDSVAAPADSDGLKGLLNLGRE